jgi:type VI secretion system secreted protein Hcp
MMRIGEISACFVFAVLVVAAAGSSVAATDAYIKFDGIDGESRDSNHKGWSDLLSFDQSIHKPDAAVATTRRRGAVVLEDIVVVKGIDKASPKLSEAVCKGKVFPKVEIHLASGPTTWYAYELTNAQVTSYSVSGPGSSGEAPMEEVSIRFEGFKVIYTERDSSGRPKGNVEFEWRAERAVR